MGGGRAMGLLNRIRHGAIPADWLDVTPQWMTAQLHNACPDAVVASVELLTRDDGTNRRARFGVTYRAGAGPEQVFIKAHAPGHRLVHLRNGNLFNEARLFASGAALPVDHPRVYHAMPDYLRLDFLLVMEDLLLRGAEPRDATRPYTVEQVENGLRGLARLHSAYWRQPAHLLKPLRWVKTWRPAKGWQIGLRNRIPTGLQRVAERLPAQFAIRDADEIVDLWSRYVALLSRGDMTLLHADAHIGNTYLLPGDDIGFLDWQVVRWGNWSQDVGYFLISALPVEVRQQHDGQLLDSYLAALNSAGGEPRVSRETALLYYRASAAYGLAIWLSTMGTDGWQSSEISARLAVRYASAFVDLDTVDALRELEARYAG